MFKVYILQSLVDPTKSYVGKTIKPVSNRLNEHNNGLSTYTKPYKPWKLVYYETFYCQICEDIREIFLKSGKGFKFRKMFIKNQNEL